MIATPTPRRMSVAEYLAWEPLQDIRHEYVQGSPIAMAGGTVPHNNIAVNLLAKLYGIVSNQGCRINIADVKLQTNQESTYRYPDLIVTCDPRDLQNPDFIQHPTLIIEVLSPTTEATDRGDKLTEYRNLPSLQEYALISVSKISIEIYRRGEGRMMLYYPYGPGDNVRFDSLDIEIPIADIYANVTIPHPSPRTN